MERFEDFPQECSNNDEVKFVFSAFMDMIEDLRAKVSKYSQIGEPKNFFALEAEIVF